MRAADAEDGAMLVCRNEHRGQISGSAVAKLEVLGNVGRGVLCVRVVESWFGRPSCLRHRAGDADDECRVRWRYCWPWSEAHERNIAERQARGAEGRRQRAVVENIVVALGIGTVAPNGRVFFEYDETVALAQRLGLQFTSGGDERERP